MLETYPNTKSATYVVKENDTYVRTVFNYTDNTSLCLNPIVRYSGEQVQSLKNRSCKYQGHLVFADRIFFNFPYNSLFLRQKTKK